MTTATTIQTPAIASILHQIRFCRGATKKMLEGITPDQYCTQPGTCVNHALWTLGHLATTDDYFIGEFSGTKGVLEPRWNEMFGMGSTPVADASKYPSIEEVTKALDERHAAVLHWVGSLTPGQLTNPTPEGWKPYAPTLGDVPPFMVWHEGYHQGQLAVLRHGLGLPRAFG